MKALINRLASNPRIYDLIQRVAGQASFDSFLWQFIQDFDQQTILDLGSGTGSLIPLIPPTSQYFGLDLDPLKLEGFKQKFPTKAAVRGDCTLLPFANKSIDFTASVALAHHLSDEQFKAFINEASRVTKRWMMFADGILSKRWLSRLMWIYDRGSNPRAIDVILKFIETEFDVVRVDSWIGPHEFILCVSIPKT